MMVCMEFMNTYMNERYKNEIIYRDLLYEVQKLTNKLNNEEYLTENDFEYYKNKLQNEWKDLFMLLPIVIVLSTFAIIKTYLYFKK